VRYRDSGARPATGRAGSVELYVHAVLNGDGRVLVLAQAGTSNALALAPPLLSQVQLKGYDRNGRLRFTETDNRRSGTPTAEYLVGGLVPGDRVQVQATIRGADVWRVGVVTVDATVRVAPNLAVTALSAPAAAAVGTPVNVSAIVQETNGELGASADCELLVGGVVVDRAAGIWVDAGGVVTCLFTHVFEQAGTHQLEARVTNVSPADYDPTDNAKSASIDITAGGAGFAFDAAYEDRRFDEYGEMTGGWISADGQTGNEWGFATASDGRTQQATLTGRFDAAVAFPLAEVEVRQRTAGADVHYRSFTNLEATSPGCAELFLEEPTGNAWLNLCVVDGATLFGYATYAGDVTYRSGWYQTFWNGDDRPDNVWVWNVTPGDPVGVISEPGWDYAFLLRVRDGGVDHTVDPVVPLASFVEAEETPSTCTQTTDQWGTSFSCTESRSSATLVTGTLAGGTP
jgi:hypothetical protein